MQRARPIECNKLNKLSAFALCKILQERNKALMGRIVAMINHDLIREIVFYALR